jgi:hypothetical protein
MTETEPPFDGEKVERLFVQQQRLFASLDQIADRLQAQVNQALMASAGVRVLTLGGVGIPKELAEKVITALDGAVDGMQKFRSAVVDSQEHA